MPRLPQPAVSYQRLLIEARHSLRTCRAILQAESLAEAQLLCSRVGRSVGAVSLRAAAQSALIGLALAGCSIPQLPAQLKSNGETACLVRGLGGPLTSYVTAGKAVLERLGYRVEVHDMGVSPAGLEHCGVVVAHSLGAQPALRTHGPHDIFIVDGFAVDGMQCPDGARCISFWNVSNVTGWHVDGAENIAASGVDAMPFLGHLTMPASGAVWGRIAAQLSPVTEARR